MMKTKKQLFIIPVSFIILIILIFTLNQDIIAQADTLTREYVVTGRVFLKDGRPMINEMVMLAYCTNKKKCNIWLTINVRDESTKVSNPYGYTDDEGLFEIKFDQDFIAEITGEYKFLSLKVMVDKTITRLKKDELPVLFILDQFDSDNTLDLEELVFDPS